MSGTAVRGVDYNFGVPIGATLVIPAGNSSLDIAVNVLDDWLTEVTEAVRIELVDVDAGDFPTRFCRFSPAATTAE